MTPAIEPEDWLGFMDREYLGSFIPEGGSAIKFAVLQDRDLNTRLLQGLSEIATRSGYLVAAIDAAATRVNMIDEIFFRVAQQVPWRILSQKTLKNLAAEAGYEWAESTEEPLHHKLARHNGVDPQLLLLDLKKVIGDKVFRNRNLSRDFRVAMTSLVYC